MVSLTLFRNEETQSIEPGQVIFSAGETGKAMYVVTEGEVEIRIGDLVAETVMPGGVFGEMALIDHAPRSATAVAKTPARIAMLDERRFNFMVTQTPNFALQVMSVMADRLRRSNTRMTSPA